MPAKTVADRGYARGPPPVASSSASSTANSTGAHPLRSLTAQVLEPAPQSEDRRRQQDRTHGHHPSDGHRRRSFPQYRDAPGRAPEPAATGLEPAREGLTD